MINLDTSVKKLEKYSDLLRGKEGKTVNTPMERALKLRKSEVRPMSKD